METTTRQSTCPNCGCECDSPYCPQCGQRRGPAQISWQTLWEGSMSTLVGDGFDGEHDGPVRYGAPGTLWRIVRHPVVTVTDFLSGHRRRYFNPLALLLLLSGICALLNSWFGMTFIDIPPIDVHRFEISEHIMAAIHYATTHPAVQLLATVPFLALACKWIFRPRKLRYIEFFYIGIFTSVISVLLLILLSPIGLPLGGNTHTWMEMFPVLCIETAIYRRIFGRGYLRTALNLLLGYGISIALMLLLTTLLTFVYGIAITT